MEWRNGRVRPHASMNGRKTIERHGGQWWVSTTVYSLLLTDFKETIRSLTVVERPEEKR